MVGPKYARPAVPTAPADRGQLPAEFKESNGWKQAQPAEASLRQDWWRIFGSAELDDLESQVDVSNQTLKSAEARFREARTLVAQSRSALYPNRRVSPLDQHQPSLRQTRQSPADHPRIQQPGGAVRCLL